MDARLAALERAATPSQTSIHAPTSSTPLPIPSIHASLPDKPSPALTRAPPVPQSTHQPLPSQAATFAQVTQRNLSPADLAAFRRPRSPPPPSFVLPSSDLLALTETIAFRPVHKMPIGALKGILRRAGAHLASIVNLDYVNTAETRDTGFAILEIIVARSHAARHTSVLSTRLGSSPIPNYNPSIASDPKATEAVLPMVTVRHRARCLASSRRDGAL